LFFFSHNYIRFGLTRAKSLQTVSRFTRETRCRSAIPKSNAFTLFFIELIRKASSYRHHFFLWLTERIVIRKIWLIPLWKRTSF